MRLDSRADKTADKNLEVTAERRRTVPQSPQRINGDVYEWSVARFLPSRLPTTRQPPQTARRGSPLQGARRSRNQ